MDSRLYDVGDFVWAKMKNFPAWPAKVVEPKENIKKPSNKSLRNFVYFYGSENYAYMSDETVWPYEENRDRFNLDKRVPKGFKEGVEAIEEAIKASPPRPPKKRPPPIVEEDGAKEAKQKKSKKDKEVKAKKRPSSPVSSAPKKSRKSNGPSRSSADSASLKLPSNKSIDSAIDRLKSKLDPGLPTEPPLFPDYLPMFKEGSNAKNVIATPMKIGFLGLGTMGSGIVNNLLRSGHEVTVWNRTPSKCKEFVKEGALKATSPAELVQDCDISFSCVSDPTALKDLVFGSSGVLQGISQGKAYIDMSTVDVDTISDIHEAITVHGGRFLEAPIIGSKEMSESGQLLVLAAGDKSVFEDCYSCFEAMARKAYFLGEVGSAAKMQLVSSLCSSTVMAGLAESLSLAEKVGLDQDQVLQILSMTSVNCQLIKHKGVAMTSSEFSDASYKLHLCQKDIRLAVNMSDTVDQPLHVGAAVNELFKKAKSKGYGEHDVAAVYRAANL